METGIWHTRAAKNGTVKEAMEDLKISESKEGNNLDQQQNCFRPMESAMIICGCSPLKHSGRLKANAVKVYRFIIFILSLLYVGKTIASFWFIDKKLFPAQAGYLMWVLTGFNNFIIGLKVNSVKFGHHNKVMRQWSEVVCKLNKHGVSYCNKTFRRNQLILLVIATLINVSVMFVHAAHIPDKPLLHIFDGDYMTAPFKPTVEMKIIVTVIAFIQSMLFSVPVFHIITLCMNICMQFSAFHKHLKQEIIDSACKLPDTFQELRILHNNLCGIVCTMDKDLRYYYGNAFVLKIMLALTALYMMLKADMAVADMLVYVYFFSMSVSFLMALSIYAAMVNEGAHAPLETIYYINVSDVNVEKLAQLNLFLSKLTGTQIGFSTCGLLIITKEFILTIAGVFLTYFAVLYTL